MDFVLKCEGEWTTAGHAKKYVYPCGNEGEISPNTDNTPNKLTHNKRNHITHVFYPKHREALAQRLQNHIDNGVTIWLAFHTGPDAPSAFVASDGRGQDEGTLIGASVICIDVPFEFPYSHHVQIRVFPFQVSTFPPPSTTSPSPASPPRPSTPTRSLIPSLASAPADSCRMSRYGKCANCTFKGQGKHSSAVLRNGDGRAHYNTQTQTRYKTWGGKVADAYKRKGIATRMLAHFEETELREAEFCGSSDGGAIP